MYFTIPRSKRLSKDTLPKDIVEDSIYVFLLSEDLFAFFSAVFVVCVQFFILYKFWISLRSFKEELGYNEETGAWATVTERDEGLEAVERTNGDIALAVFLLFLHTFGDVIKGGQLMSIGWKRGRGNSLATGSVILFIGIATFVTGILYVRAESLNSLATLQDVFVLVFVLDVDEKAFDILRYWNENWTGKVLEKIDTDPDAPPEPYATRR
jgi:hypothetical protein